jgi:hypothetical protein
MIKDEIREEDFEDDDDGNFASPVVDPERMARTSLYPPPFQIKQAEPQRLRPSFPNLRAETKPLPSLPNHEFSPVVVASPTMIPAPLNLTYPTTLNPRSHFSIDTVATGFVSPTDSHFSEIPSIYDSYDDSNDDDGDGDGENLNEDSFTDTIVDSPERRKAFQYTLPTPGYGSDTTLTLKKDPSISTLNLHSLDNKVDVRATFGPQVQPKIEMGMGIGESVGMEEQMSALDDLLKEMGWLGDVIVGK